MIFKSNKKPWRNNDGHLYCPGDKCSMKKCDETCPIYINTLCAGLMAAEQYEEAIRLYEKAIRIAPDMYDANNNLGSCYGALGNYENAYKYYLKAYEICPGRPNNIFGLALSCKDLDNQDECLKWCIEYENYSNDGRLRELKESLENKSSDNDFITQVDSLLQMSLDDLIKTCKFPAYYIKDIYQPDDFCNKAYEFCLDCYKAKGEKVIFFEMCMTAFYGCICTVGLWNKNPSIFEKNTAWYVLSKAIDTEFTDRNAEKLMGTKAGEDKAENVFELFKMFFNLVPVELFNQFGLSNKDILISIMHNAYKWGMIIATNEFDLKKNFEKIAYEPIKKEVSSKYLSVDKYKKYIGKTISIKALLGNNFYHYIDGKRTSEALKLKMFDGLNTVFDNDVIDELDEELTVLIPNDCWIKKRNLDDEKINYVICIGISEDCSITYFNIFDEIVTPIGGNSFAIMVPGVELLTRKEYTECSFSDLLSLELMILTNNEYIPNEFSFIGHKMPRFMIDRELGEDAKEYRHSYYSPYRFAYIHLLLSFNDENEIVDIDYTTYQRNGNEMADMFTRPVKLCDRQDEALAVMLNIFCKFDAEEI